MLNLLSLRNTQGIKDPDQAFRTEEPHQIILQGNVEFGFSRVSLTAGPSAELVINPSGFMALGTHDLQAAGGNGLLVQLNIGTTTGHVRRDRHGSVDTGIGHDLGFDIMELGVQNLVRDASSL